MANARHKPAFDTQSPKSAALIVRALACAGVIAVAALGVACSDDSDRGKRTDVGRPGSLPPTEVGPAGDEAVRQTDTGADTDEGEPLGGPKKDPANGAAENTIVLDEVGVMTFLADACTSCHGEADDGTKAPNYSSWPLTKDALSQESFETSIYAPLVYAALFNKISDTPTTTPSQMPLGSLDATATAKVRGVIGWFNVTLPFVVAEAEQVYGIKSTSKAGKTTLQFTCKNPVTSRVFLNRVTAALFDRPPTANERDALFNDVDLGKPVTREQRAKVVAMLRSPAWKSEFVEGSGLRKLASAIGGGPAIDADSPALPAGAAQDLKEEFYQLLHEHYDDWAYEDYLETDKVMVSSTTAPLYGCATTPAAGNWEECVQKAPRGGFFTTLGYLNSKPSSFLKENNNYGRVSAMYLTVMGQGFRAATDGPAGTEIAPLPACLETTDTRTLEGAARGTAAVPAFGNICQSCHISRNLANGAVLFRPFGTNGQIYDPATLGDNGTLDKTLFDAAVLPGWQYVSSPGESIDFAQPVTQPWLKDLLSASLQKTSIKACAVTGRSDKPTVPLKTVADLAGYIMQNKSALVRGFVRHAHRAYSVSQTVNFDLVYAAIEAYAAGKNKVPDLLEAYFESETFACASGG
jgi:hypothetical protein